MVVLHPPNSVLVSMMRLVLGAQRHIQVAETWGHVHKFAPLASALVLERPQLTSAEVEQIVRMRDDIPTLPILLITASDPANARRLNGLGVAEVVWHDEVESGLRARLQTLFAGDVLESIASGVEHGSEVSVLVRRVVALALRKVPPFPSVTAWLAQAGVARQSVYATWPSPWRSFLSTPAELVDFVLTLRAVQARSRGCSWPDAAFSVGTTTRRLQRIALRLTNAPLRAYEDRDAARRFARPLVALTRARASD